MIIIIINLTDEKERSGNGDERNVSQGSLETVTSQMLLGAVASDASEAREQEAGDQDIAYSYKQR